MAECEWLILCDYAFLDQGQKPCMIGVFDRINVHAVPAQHPQAAIVAKLVGDARERVKFAIEILRPNGGQVLATIGGDSQLSDTGSTHINVMIGGLVVPDVGVYDITVKIDEGLPKQISFTVAVVAQN